MAQIGFEVWWYHSNQPTRKKKQLFFKDRVEHRIAHPVLALSSGIPGRLCVSRLFIAALKKAEKPKNQTQNKKENPASCVLTWDWGKNCFSWPWWHVSPNSADRLFHGRWTVFILKCFCKGSRALMHCLSQIWVSVYSKCPHLLHWKVDLFMALCLNCCTDLDSLSRFFHLKCLKSDLANL